jgi:hypothetical protein
MENVIVRGRRLGKQEARQDFRTLKLARYLGPKLPPAPLACDWLSKVKALGSMLNTEIGDCTIAACGHEIQQWTTYARPQASVPSDKSILKVYEAISGYNPKDPTTDSGCVVLDVLNYWRKNGIAGHNILAYVSVNPTNSVEVMQAIHLFGNLYLGLSLPLSAQNQKVWRVPLAGPMGNGEPGSWGGHAVPVGRYGRVTPTGPQGLTCVTWGALQSMTWDFFGIYVDECFAILSMDWIEQTGLSPDNFSLAQLQKDLAALA